MWSGLEVGKSKLSGNEEAFHQRLSEGHLWRKEIVSFSQEWPARIVTEVRRSRNPRNSFRWSQPSGPVGLMHRQPKWEMTLVSTMTEHSRTLNGSGVQRSETLTPDGRTRAGLLEGEDPAQTWQDGRTRRGQEGVIGRRDDSAEGRRRGRLLSFPSECGLYSIRGRKRLFYSDGQTHGASCLPLG